MNRPCMSDGCVCVCVCKRWFVETVRLLGVDVCGRPVVSENGKEGVNA
jgi:hypothetical protein